MKPVTPVTHTHDGGADASSGYSGKRSSCAIAAGWCWPQNARAAVGTSATSLTFPPRSMLTCQYKLHR